MAFRNSLNENDKNRQLLYLRNSFAAAGKKGQALRWSAATAMATPVGLLVCATLWESLGTSDLIGPKLSGGQVLSLADIRLQGTRSANLVALR